MHRHLINYSSDTLPLKVCPNNSKNTDNCDPSQIHGESFSHMHYHHGTCQRHYTTQDIMTPLAHKGL